MTLHETIEMILQETGRPMSSRDIADIVNKRNLYTRKDGKPVTATQISARVRNYEHLFSRDLDRIKLVENDLVSLKVQEIKSELIKLAKLDLKEEEEAVTLIEVLKEKELYDDTLSSNLEPPPLPTCASLSMEDDPFFDFAFEKHPDDDFAKEEHVGRDSSVITSLFEDSDTEETTPIEPRYKASYKPAYSKRDKNTFWDRIFSFFKGLKPKESVYDAIEDSAAEEESSEDIVLKASAYEDLHTDDNVVSEAIGSEDVYHRKPAELASYAHHPASTDFLFEASEYEAPITKAFDYQDTPASYFENLKITYTIFRWFLIQKYREVPLLSEELASFIAGLYWFKSGEHKIYSDFEHTIHDLIKVVYENPNAKFKVHNHQLKWGESNESTFARTANRFIESIINKPITYPSDDANKIKTGIFILPFTNSTKKDKAAVEELLKRLNFENPVFDKAIIIVADKFLSSKQEGETLFKEKILKEKCLEAVVHFSKDLIVNAIVDMSLLVLDFNKQKEEVFLYNTLSQKALLSTTIFNEKREEPNVSKRTSVNDLLKDSYNLSPKRYIVDPSLAHLESGYSLVKIKNLVQDKKLGRFIHKRKLYSDGEYKVIRNMDIDKSTIYFRSKPSYPILGADHDEIADIKSLLVEGGIVLTEFKEELKVNMLFKGEKYLLGSEVYWLQLDEDKILPEYFVRETAKQYVVNQVKQHASGIGINRISFEDILEIQIKVPSIEQQSKLVIADSSKDLDSLSKAKDEASDLDFIYTLEHSLKQPASGLGNDLASLCSFLENKAQLKDALKMEESIVPLFDTDTPEQIAIHTLSSTLSRMQRAVTDIDYILRQARLLATAKTKSILEQIGLLEFLQNIANESRDIRFHILGDKTNIMADRKQLRILFNNFIDNARRHGFKEIEEFPTIWIVIDSTNPYETKITIRNNGKALPAEFHIEDFLAKGKSSKLDVGSGFGGFLIGQILKNHNGVVSLTDKSELELVPYNVEFVITLPKEV